MPPKPRKPDGIAPTLLLEQVKGRAAWAFAIDPPLPAAQILAKATEIEREWKKGEGADAYFAALLAAHFTTVATFSPTDVDVRIRQHVWSPLAGKKLAAAIDRVLDVATWDVRPVSARYVQFGTEAL